MKELMNKSIHSTNIHIAQSLHEMKIEAEPGSFHDFSSLSVKILLSYLYEIHLHETTNTFNLNKHFL